MWIRLIVGPDDGPGDESFDVLVCTPIWVGDVIKRDGPQIGRHRLLVDPFDLPAAVSFLKDRFEAVEADDWSTLCEQLARMGHWEFEGDRPFQEADCGDGPGEAQLGVSRADRTRIQVGTCSDGSTETRWVHGGP